MRISPSLTNPSHTLRTPDKTVAEVVTTAREPTNTKA